MSFFVEELTQTSSFSLKPKLYEFKELIRAHSPLCDLATEVVQGVPIYNCSSLSLSDPQQVSALQIEWAQVLERGAGVLCLRQAFGAEIVDESSSVFFSILAEQEPGVGADHFAVENLRLWNALQKLCLKEPECFIQYYANPFLTLISQAWLGEGYQLTSQINNVKPGGKAQDAHRDYHLGFMTKQKAQCFPLQQHRLSQFLTLQGAVAHCDMSIESGVTKILPGSQRYDKGYVAMHETDFQEYFEDNCVQLPLKKGDAVFFNPALFHAAGENKTNNVQRLANLLQVSSAFGRAMESVDRLQMGLKLYPYLLKVEDSVASLAVKNSLEGYAFPTNLDIDPPQGRLTSETPADFTLRALKEKWSLEKYGVRLKEIYKKRAA